MDAPERLDERVKCRGVPLEFTQESVSQFFGGTMAAAARRCGVSLCTMKRVCRRLGLVWPKSTRREHAPVKQLKERKKRKQVVFPATPETVVRVFPKGREWMDVSIDTLSGMFGGTQEAAAGRLGVSLWTLKRVCRRLGMAWPKSDPRRHAVLVASMELPAWRVEDLLV